MPARLDPNSTRPRQYVARRRQIVVRCNPLRAGDVRSPRMANITFVRIAVAIGLGIDTAVAIVALFFQSLLGPLFDFPLKDPALTTIAGGEYVVVALVYAFVFREPKRYAALLWLCALDQFFAAVLPGIEIARGNVAATWKTIGPIPLNALLAIVYAVLASGAGARRGGPVR